MNTLTKHLEDFKQENWSLFNKSTQDLAVRSVLNMIQYDSNPVEADYSLNLFQFKAIFENNVAIAEISKLQNSGTSTFIFYKALSMLRVSEIEAKEAVEICLDIINRVYKPRSEYEFLISGTPSFIFKYSFEITQNKETLKVICDSYLDDLISGETDEININVAPDFFDLLSFSYKGEEKFISQERAECIFETYIKPLNDKAGFFAVMSKYYKAMKVLIEVLKKTDFEILKKYLTEGSSAIGIADLTLNFEDKEEVFEIIDQIEEDKIEYYKGKFAVPKGSVLTDEDIQIYGSVLYPIEIIDNVTIEQALKFGDIFKPQMLIEHKNFTLDLLNLLNVSIDVINKVLKRKNYLQEELITIADLLSIHQLKSSHCLITPELFKAVNDSNYELNFIYESQEPLDLFIGESVNKENFNVEFINEIRKIYKCSSGDIFKSVLTFKDYSKNMDEKTKKTFEAFNKIFKD